MSLQRTKPRHYSLNLEKHKARQRSLTISSDDILSFPLRRLNITWCHARYCMKIWTGIWPVAFKIETEQEKYHFHPQCCHLKEVGNGVCGNSTSTCQQKSGVVEYWKCIYTRESGGGGRSGGSSFHSSAFVKWYGIEMWRTEGNRPGGAEIDRFWAVSALFLSFSARSLRCRGHAEVKIEYCKKW